MIGHDFEFYVTRRLSSIFIIKNTMIHRCHAPPPRSWSDPISTYVSSVLLGCGCLLKGLGLERTYISQNEPLCCAMCVRVHYATLHSHCGAQ